MKTCLKSTRYNSNTSLNMHDTYTASMHIIHGQNLSDYIYQSSIVNNLSTSIEIDVD